MLLQVKSDLGLLSENGVLKDLEAAEAEVRALRGEIASAEGRLPMLRDAWREAQAKAAEAQRFYEEAKGAGGTYGMHASKQRARWQQAVVARRVAGERAGAADRRLRYLQRRLEALEATRGRDLALLCECREAAAEALASERARLEQRLSEATDGEAVKAATARDLLAVQKRQRKAAEDLLLLESRERELVATLLRRRWRAEAEAIFGEVQDRVHQALEAARALAEARPEAASSPVAREVAAGRAAMAAAVVADPTSLWQAEIAAVLETHGQGVADALRELATKDCPQLGGWAWQVGGREITVKRG
jgi:hypothetical protein